ncbi:hypothetical protein JKP88DRAFT_263583 [Tribonema minus]|uniref:Uncharacterized protein n=1 Tax=Tribonema minus TaxID=303371 RepID=A0A835YXW0_9STRA|nr:hypothetical protein JKP88DRAFT_263583 [Tribonema minus]
MLRQAAAAGAVNPLDVDYAARVLDYALYHNGLMDDDMATPRIRFISALSCLKLSIIAAIGTAVAYASPNTNSLSIIPAIGTAVAYASVSPRNAPREVYMQLFQRNLLLLGTSLVGPGLFMLTLHDSSKASANAVISAFFHAFTWGYLLTVLLELVLTTVYRMAVLQVMEPQAYSACPDVPAIWLPWVLRDHGYYLKPLTAFVANFAIFCLGTPWIEEAVKVWTTRWTGWLPKRPAALAGTPATLTAVHVHTYVVLIVAAAMGLKVADNARRILLYTRHTHRHKFLFALLRGFFPLQELCAALTAMNLARRDILGERVPAWRVYLPAAALHAWANFRGTAPIVKWSADAPWVELQMGAWSLPDGITAMQLLHRGLVSLLWFSILLKVLSYTIKTYWRLSRLHNSRLRRELFR